MKNDTCSLKDILIKEQNGELLLPTFQRKFVWKVEDQRMLITTFLVDIPFNSFLMVKGNTNDFQIKRLCMNDNVERKDVDKAYDCNYLLDGQQRLSTLKNAFSDIFFRGNDWENVYKATDNKLHYRWFINLNVAELNDDIFGLRKLSMPGNLNEITPQALAPYIEYRSIIGNIDISNRTKNWWHPAFVKDNTNQELRYVIQSATQEKCIPLYRVLEDNYANGSKIKLVTPTIRGIAEQRCAELKDEINEEKITIKEVFGEEYKDNTIDDIVEDDWKQLVDNWVDAVSKILNNSLDKFIYFIQLEKNEINRAVTIFEMMNRGGTRLSVFDLLVARAAQTSSNVTIRDKINDLLQKGIYLPKSITNKNDVIYFIPQCMKLLDKDGCIKIFQDAYADMLCIYLLKRNGNLKNLSTDYIKAGKILDIPSGEINAITTAVVIALIRAYAFLQYRCGVRTHADLDYKLMILPIATVFLDESAWNDKIKVDRIEYWYWSSMFSGFYSTSQNSRCIDDVKNLYNFIFNEQITLFQQRQDKVFAKDGYSDFETLCGWREIYWSKSIHHSILSYILIRTPIDFLEGPYQLTAWGAAQKEEVSISNRKTIKLNLQDHHIIPLDSAKSIKESETELRKDKGNLLNSPLNRTFITETANKAIGGKNIQDYTEYISKFCLAQHFIPDIKINDKRKNPNKYNEEILKKRFNLLRGGVKKELIELLQC